ncbi:site-2 protease family protein [Candidatus Saccharibacteria bacterium]|nr:site-2 protease family protein [Candidatus Saccharibacteria bacterium]
MNITGAVITLVIILFSMVLHELSHGVMAYWLGDVTAKEDGRLTLNPLKHLDPFMSVLLPMMLYFMNAPVFGGAKPVPVNPRNLKGKEWGMALVALAGPLMNFILAFIGFLIFRFGGYNDIALKFTHINLGFMIFNLLPIPPLDGSRILYAISPDGVREFLTSMETFGIMLVYLLILVGGNFFSYIMIGGINGVLDFFIIITGGGMV